MSHHRRRRGKGGKDAKEGNTNDNYNCNYRQDPDNAAGYASMMANRGQDDGSGTFDSEDYSARFERHLPLHCPSYGSFSSLMGSQGQPPYSTFHAATEADKLVQSDPSIAPHLAEFLISNFCVTYCEPCEPVLPRHLVAAATVEGAPVDPVLCFIDRFAAPGWPLRLATHIRDTFVRCVDFRHKTKQLTTMPHDSLDWKRKAVFYNGGAPYSIFRYQRHISTSTVLPNEECEFDDNHIGKSHQHAGFLGLFGAKLSRWFPDCEEVSKEILSLLIQCIDIVHGYDLQPLFGSRELRAIADHVADTTTSEQQDEVAIACVRLLRDYALLKPSVAGATRKRIKIGEVCAKHFPAFSPNVFEMWLDDLRSSSDLGAARIQTLISAMLGSSAGELFCLHVLENLEKLPRCSRDFATLVPYFSYKREDETFERETVGDGASLFFRCTARDTCRKYTMDTRTFSKIATCCGAQHMFSEFLTWERHHLGPVRFSFSNNDAVVQFLARNKTFINALFEQNVPWKAVESLLEAHDTAHVLGEVVNVLCQVSFNEGKSAKNGRRTIPFEVACVVASFAFPALPREIFMLRPHAELCEVPEFLVNSVFVSGVEIVLVERQLMD